jgi:excinuclease ABC subunit C
LEFERAARIRDKILAINKIREKQKATSVDLDNKDIIALCKNGNTAAIQVFFVRNGKILGRENYFLKNLDGEENKSIIADFIKQYYSVATAIPRRIFIQEQIDDEELIAEWLSDLAGSKISLNVPQKGVNFDLLKMAETNAQEFLNLHQTLNNTYKKKADGILFEIKDLLNLEYAPMKIEVYDISNISGADNVGARVVFENAVPVKKLYRIYNIKDLENYQADDYSAIKEVLRRRIMRKEEDALPGLILIDGGKGHVSSAKEVAEELGVDVPIFGLVKTEKHRTRGVTTEKEEIAIPITSKTFHFFTRVQDEVHRFAIKAHREKHKKSVFNSELQKIKGVGEVKQAELLKKFGSLENIKNARIEELMSIKGITKELAGQIKETLGKYQNSSN